MHIFRKLSKLCLMNPKKTSVSKTSENESKEKQCAESVQGKKQGIFL